MVTTNHSGLLLSQNSIYQSVGTVLRLRQFSGTIVGGAGSYFDDAVTWSQVGTTVYTSGLVLPIGTRGTDAFLREQGKILDGDLKFYMLGTVTTSGTIVIGIGSPPPTTPREYYVLDPGPIARGLGDSVGEGTSAYKVVFGRYLQGGSLLPSI